MSIEDKFVKEVFDHLCSTAITGYQSELDDQVDIAFCRSFAISVCKLPMEDLPLLINDRSTRISEAAKYRLERGI